MINTSEASRDRLFSKYITFIIFKGEQIFPKRVLNKDLEQ